MRWRPMDGALTGCLECSRTEHRKPIAVSALRASSAFPGHFAILGRASINAPTIRHNRRFLFGI